VAPNEILHIGDNERTDVRGALSAGFRAVRLDVVRKGGPSEAEFVARSFEELSEYLLGQAVTTPGPARLTRPTRLTLSRRCVSLAARETECSSPASVLDLDGPAVHRSHGLCVAKQKLNWHL